MPSWFTVHERNANWAFLLYFFSSSSFLVSHMPSGFDILVRLCHAQAYANRNIFWVTSRNLTWANIISCRDHHHFVCCTMRNLNWRLFFFFILVPSFFKKEPLVWYQFSKFKIYHNCLLWSIIPLIFHWFVTLPAHGQRYVFGTQWGWQVP